MLHTKQKFLPKSDNGMILATTRSRDVAISVAEGAVVELPQMNLQEAKSVLQRWLAPAVLEHNATVEELLDELTYLPLAVAQAAVYIKRNQITITIYLELLRSTD